MKRSLDVKKAHNRQAISLRRLTALTK